MIESTRAEVLTIIQLQLAKSGQQIEQPVNKLQCNQPIYTEEAF